MSRCTVDTVCVLSMPVHAPSEYHISDWVPDYIYYYIVTYSDYSINTTTGTAQYFSLRSFVQHT
jgi:hypothetical protein